MAVFGVYIEKEVDYFGRRRSMGNTYHYQTGTSQIFNDEAVARQVAEAEQTVTQASVRFTRWVTWGPTDGDSFDNVMREDGEFDFAGIGIQEGAQYREACLLCVWPLPRSETTNRKRWLRKFIRLGSAATALSDSQVAGVNPLDPADIQYVFDNYIGPVTAVTSSADDTELCTADGDTPDKPGVVRPYLFTRQIGQ